MLANFLGFQLTQLEFLSPLLIRSHGFDSHLRDLIVFVDYMEDDDGVNLGVVVGEAVVCLILVYRIPLLEALLRSFGLREDISPSLEDNCPGHY